MNFLYRFSKNTQISNSVKIRPVAPCGRTDSQRRKDRHGEAILRVRLKWCTPNTLFASFLWFQWLLNQNRKNLIIHLLCCNFPCSIFLQAVLVAKLACSTMDCCVQKTHTNDIELRNIRNYWNKDYVHNQSLISL